MPSKFGFEAEFGTNVNDLIAALTADGYANQTEMHSYHCSCGTCVSSLDFRAQRDSSTGGEIISKPYANFDLASAPIEALTKAAVELDAEPALSAGLHVHVESTGIRNDADMKGRIFLQFCRFEEALNSLAGGRWKYNRGFNQSNLQNVADDISGRAYYFWSDAGLERPKWATRSKAATWPARVMEMSPAERASFMNRVLVYAYDWDRHSNLAIRTSTERTWEFRLWNSTRAAWRIHLAIGVSTAFFDPAFIAALEDITEPSMNAVSQALDSAGMTNIAAHVERQINYLAKRADTAPEYLTLSA